MVWSLGLGTPWRDASYAVADDSLPPLPRASGRLLKRRQCTPKGLFRQAPKACSSATKDCCRRRKHPGMT
eukprot:4071218-Pyramimonas_sp.AAC.1